MCNKILNSTLIFLINQYLLFTRYASMEKEIALALKKEGVEMILTEHTVNAAKHAAATGLIFTEKIPLIEQDKKEDEGQVPGKVEA